MRSALEHHARVFPARAGMSPITLVKIAQEARVPRASGDEPGGTSIDELGDKCSPRERG